MLNLEQISNNKLPLSLRWKSIDICGFDYDQLYYDLDSQERKLKSLVSPKEFIQDEYEKQSDLLIKLNKAWLKLNECALYCQDPNHLRVEINEHKLFCDFDIFINNEFRYGKRVSIKYHEQLYININNFYASRISDESMDDFIIYNKRNEMLELLS